MESHEEEDFKNLDLPDCAVHKNWRARVHAYQQLSTQIYKPGSESMMNAWQNNGHIFKQGIMDTNVMVQEQCLSALNVLLELGGPRAASKLRSITSAIIEKSLASAKPSIKAKGSDALGWLIELDSADNVIDELLRVGFENKLPRLIAASAANVTFFINQFGTSVINVKPIIPKLTALFNHSDKNVRQEASNLFLEIYRWKGNAVASILLPSIKPIQAKELEASMAAQSQSQEEPPSPKRYIYSQKSRSTETFAEVSEPASRNVQQEAAEDLFDPVSILDKIPSNYFELVNSVKWAERKEAYEALHAALKVPKLAADDYANYINSLAKGLKDSNVNCMMAAASCVELFASGLGRGFDKYQSIILSPLLERLKEKKPNIVTILSNALNAILQSCNINDLSEELIGATQHKNPQIRTETLNAITKYLQEVTIMPTPAQQKSFIEAALKVLGDSFEPVRVAAAQLLGTMMKILGELPMKSYLDEVDALRKTKIIEAFNTVTVKPKASSKIASQGRPPTAQASRSRQAGASTRQQPPQQQPSDTHRSKLSSMSSAGHMSPKVERNAKPTSSSMRAPSMSLTGRSLSRTARPMNGSGAQPLPASSTSPTKLIAQDTKASLNEGRFLKLETDVKMLQDTLVDVQSENRKLQSDMELIKRQLRMKDDQYNRLQDELQRFRILIAKQGTNLAQYQNMSDNSPEVDYTKSRETLISLDSPKESAQVQNSEKVPVPSRLGSSVLNTRSSPLRKPSTISSESYYSKPMNSLSLSSRNLSSQITSQSKTDRVYDTGSIKEYSNSDQIQYLRTKLRGAIDRIDRKERVDYSAKSELRF